MRIKFNLQFQENRKQKPSNHPTLDLLLACSIPSVV